MHLTFDAELYGPLRNNETFLEEQGLAWKWVLDVLEERLVRVTHFVTGQFAETYPELFERMTEQGHEIASHTMTHRPYSTIGEAVFSREVSESRLFLEKLSGHTVLGFRAPYGQVPDNLAEILHKNGYIYDSSIAATHIPGRFEGFFTPKRIYNPAFDDIRRPQSGTQVWEIPISVSPILPLPYGGTFLPCLSPFVIRLPGIRRNPHVMFLHPYDFVDLRPYAESRIWHKIRFTENNRRLLEYFSKEMAGKDTRLIQLITEA